MTAYRSTSGRLLAMALNQSHLPTDVYAPLDLLRSEGLEGLMSRARDRRDERDNNVITYSPKVFIPLTKACRDVCHYCTFATPPKGRAYMTIDEVLEVARAGAAAGCTEALFTLGDKPELRYRRVAQELESLGHSTTIEYLERAAAAVMKETGLLPHLNPGVMGPAEVELLRPVSASMGLMIESTSYRLVRKDGPHHGSPDKIPAVRLATLDVAGRHRVPFTTGILIGIGETFEERLEALWRIAESHRRWGHVQEVIVQNFRAKPGTRMADAKEPDLEDMLATLAAARLILPPEVSVQAPPNLAESDDSLLAYIAAGIDDWGGVSPVTIDHVNPEAPWPHLDRLREVTARAGFLLRPRLTVYPRFAADPAWVDPEVRPYVLAASDSEGLAFSGRWHAGAPAPAPDVVSELTNTWKRNHGVRLRSSFSRALHKATAQKELLPSEIEALLSAKGPETNALFQAADALRREINGDKVTFVVNRNINYTNMCYFRCGFCAFSKGPKSLNLRGEPYLIEMDEIAERTREAYESGATEVCLQGGIHPSFTGDYYVQVVRTIKEAVPDIHIHAFSPLEVWQGASTKGVPLRDLLWELKDAGLGTLPGTAAEILDDRVRRVICPDKINTAQWSEVARTAHGLGLKMTTTMMFGHADDLASWANHLVVLRDIQRETGGFTEFVPLPFVHMGAPIFLKGHAREGPTFEETLKVHAVARLALHPWITNIQVSWVKLGVDGARQALAVGCNDLGGTLMNESISRAAGASHGQGLSMDEMKGIIASAGRPWAQRNTLYGLLEKEAAV